METVVITIQFKVFRTLIGYELRWRGTAPSYSFEGLMSVPELEKASIPSHYEDIIRGIQSLFRWKPCQFEVHQEPLKGDCQKQQ